MWNIKRLVKKGDYAYAVVPEHPNATKHGYVLYHRVVAENIIGRLLNASEVVHHKDGNKWNNAPENLEVLDRSEHSRKHGREKCSSWAVLNCPNCGKRFERRIGNSMLGRKTQYTCCSNHCRGVFSRKIQLNGVTKEIQKAINENLVETYRKKLKGMEQ